MLQQNSLAKHRIDDRGELLIPPMMTVLQLLARTMQYFIFVAQRSPNQPYLDGSLGKRRASSLRARPSIGCPTKLWYPLYCA